jgi:Sap, sulfolipid-1-addressing protein
MASGSLPGGQPAARSYSWAMALLEIFFIACGAMFFPLLLIVVVLALNTSRPVPILAWFLAGGLLTTITVGSAIVAAFKDSPHFSTPRGSGSAWIDLVVGALAVLAGLVLQSVDRRRALHPKPKSTEQSRSSALIERLVEKGAPLAFVAGILATIVPGLLPIIGMKNIAALGYSSAETLVVVVCFYLVMFSFVEAPLVGFFVAPEWTKSTALRFNAWLATNLLRVAAIALFVVGAVELVRGIFIRF